MTARLVARDSRPARPWLVPLAFAALLTSCVSRQSDQHLDSSSNDSDGPLASRDTQSPVDFPPAPKSCGQLRTCLNECGDDSACKSYCMTTAPAAATKVNATVQACSLQACPQQDFSCRCDAECVFPGACVDAVNQCTEGNSDPFCEQHCH